MSTTSTTLSQRPVGSNPFIVIERILRDREGIWRQISSEQRLGELITQMLISIVVSFGCYGFVLGIWNSDPLQAVASMVKLPLLFLLTLAICLPTLYLFNLVFGSTLSLRQALALVMTAITVTAVLTLAFAPISLFFMLTAKDYEFFKLLNVAILALTGIVGLEFLVHGTRQLNRLSQPATQLDEAPASLASQLISQPQPAEAPAAEKPRSANMALVYLWIVLFGFVGTQLGWTLRPFFGDPGQAFTIFRYSANNSNFYINIIDSVASLFY